MEKLKELIELRGLNISTLSELMSKKNQPLSRVSLTKIINGTSSPRISTLEAIAEVLECEVSDLIDSREKPRNKSTTELLDQIKDIADEISQRMSKEE